MKYEFTDRCKGDIARLKPNEREIIRDRLPDFNAACEAFAKDPSTKWPDSLRVGPVEDAPGILEMTFSFTGPDLRATFEWTQIDSELAVRWRRIGGHSIFKKP